MNARSRSVDDAPEPASALAWSSRTTVSSSVSFRPFRSSSIATGLYHACCSDSASVRRLDGDEEAEEESSGCRPGRAGQGEAEEEDFAREVSPGKSRPTAKR